MRTPLRGTLRVNFRTKARTRKRETFALWLAARDSRTPWAAKLVIAIVSAYALSPIDLIPDFIPILAYLDDLVLLPLGIFLALKLIPANVLADAQQAAHQANINLAGSRAAAVMIVVLGRQRGDRRCVRNVLARSIVRNLFSVALDRYFSLHSR